MFFLFLIYAPLLFLVSLDRFHDPGPGIFGSKSASQSLECTFVSSENINKSTSSSSREGKSNFIEESFLSCEQLVFAPHERHPRDERILLDLSATTARAVALVKDRFPQVEKWQVAVEYPVSAVAVKIAVAAQTGLAQAQVKVLHEVAKQRTASLFRVNSALSPQNQRIQALPVECKEAFLLKSYSPQPTEGLMVFAVASSLETSLHVGACAGGGPLQWLL
jgi:hypothetical protein